MELECFPLPFTSTLAECLRARLGPTIVQSHTLLYSKGGLLALPTYIRVGQRIVTATNRLAYEMNFGFKNIYL
jgi:hypothetical protein